MELFLCKSEWMSSCCAGFVLGGGGFVVVKLLAGLDHALAYEPPHGAAPGVQGDALNLAVGGATQGQVVWAVRFLGVTPWQLGA